MAEKIQERNREAWLTDAIAMITPLIKQRTGLSPLKPIKVSVGFPPSGGRTRANTGKPGTIGVCCMHDDNKYNHIFIHPLFDGDSLLASQGVMEILTHETLHACLPAAVGHRKEFSQAAKKMGLLPEGAKPKSTALSDELRDLYVPLVEQLGDYPHESLVSNGKVQGTRLILCECPMCGYKVRTTRTWLESAGEPICPQDLVPMQEGGVGEDVENPLIPVHQTVEYRVKPTPEAKRDAKMAKLSLPYDPRWAIRMNREQGSMAWWIVDYGEPYREVDGMKIAVLGLSQPRLTPAETREDAIALMEALRDGTMTYADVTYDDDNPELDIDPDSEYEDDDDDETEDYPDDSDPRFQWEIDKGIEFDPEAEQRRREAA